MCDLTVLLFYPFEISVNLLLKFSLTLLSPVSVRQVIEFVISMKNVGNHVVGFLSHSAFSSFQSNGLDKIGKRASRMNPTAGNPEVFPFISELVIDLITVRNNGTGEVLQEFSWMVGFSGSLPIVKDNRVCGAQALIAVNPHIGFLPTFYPGIVDTHYLDRRFVGMNHLVFIDKFMQAFIDQGKIALCAVYDPVRHGVGGKVNAVTLVSSGLSFQRKGIRIFTVDDGYDQRRGGDTVAEQI